MFPGALWPDDCSLDKVSHMLFDFSNYYDGCCKGTPHHFPYSLSLPLMFRTSTHLPELFPETPDRPPEPRYASRHHFQGTPLYSPLPHSFLCMCPIILAGFPYSILFGSPLARSVVSSPCMYILFLYILIILIYSLWIIPC